MKTQVIQLEPHDDIVSVRDKMSWAKAPRLLLVYPHHSRLLTRSLDLLLLRRHAFTLGAQLALVTRSLEIRRAAHELGLPVFASITAAQREAWPLASRLHRPSRRAPRPDFENLRAEAIPSEPAWSSKPAVRFICFSFGVLAILAVLLLFIPSAEITLYPTSQTQSLALPVSASPAVEAVSVTGSLPAHIISVTIAGSKTIPASGHMTISDQSAQGFARFRNLTDAAISIPAGTVVRTRGESALRFVTLQEGVLEAGVDSSVDISIRAVLPGSAGNVPADAIVAIEGQLGPSLAVSNPEPTTGGTDRTVISASASDRSAVYRDLLRELRRMALSRIAAQLAEGDLLFPDTIILAQTLNEEYLPVEGQPGDYLTLNLTLEFTARYAAIADLTALAAAALDVGLPAGFIPVPDTLKVASVGALVTGADGVTHGRLSVARYLTPRIDFLAVARLVRGRTPAAAGLRLASALDLESPPQIRLAPSWWPWLPFTEVRITINK